jgi:L-gulonolactone oxidase
LTRVRAWGRIGGSDAPVAAPRFRGDLDDILRLDGSPRLAIGARRSYGDSGLLSRGRLIDMTGLDRFQDFDPATGLLNAEAGVLLADIMAAFVPRGWFVPVTPGTRYVTLAGAIANDVHGKNHHVAGTFGRHVTSLRLRRSDGPPREISADGDGDMFAATVGGLGLTGVIESACLRLQPITSAWLKTETIPFDALDAFVAISRDRSHLQHSVAWIDCTASGRSLGRGIFTGADWLGDGRLEPHPSRQAQVPAEAPGWLLNPLSLRAFNALYDQKERFRPRHSQAHYSSVFHPLDAIGDWNRLYGPAGFYQYQCVTPLAAGIEPVRDLLRLVSASGQGSTLAVLKRFGDLTSPGMLSFPAPGFTLALDFPNRGERTLALLSRLDEVVARAGGRLYPAKDGRMSRDLFEAGYPGLGRFRRHRDPAAQSDFGLRMGL